MAVLDSKFRVRGTEGLRVVDASVSQHSGILYPDSNHMISEKAAAEICGS
jgi:choline dehydrogenase